MDILKVNEIDVTVNSPFTMIIHKSQEIDRTSDSMIEFQAYGRCIMKDSKDEFTFILTSPITSKPNEIKDVGNYYELVFEKDSIFSANRYALMDLSFVEMFFGNQTYGKINIDIPYEHQNLITQNIYYNNNPIPANPRYYEIFNSAIFRVKGNPKKFRRLFPGTPYYTMSARELVSQNSTTAAATFQDPSLMLLINVNRKEEDEVKGVLSEFLSY